MPDTLHLATDALHRYAGQRIEDGYIYQALYYYLNEVGRVQRRAWGELPWSEQWWRGWLTATGYRMDEARTCRDKLAEIGGTLLQILADFTHTDQTSAVAINLANEDTLPYLRYVTSG